MKSYKKTKEKKVSNRYMWIVPSFIALFLVTVIIGIVFDCVLDKQIPFYNFENKSSEILSVLGIMWTLTAGIIIYAVQCGFGKKMGLDMLDILLLNLDVITLWILIFIIAAKILIYVYGYVFETKQLLFLLPIDAVLSLGLICAFTVVITDNTSILNLVKKQIDRSFEKKKCKGTFCEIILKMAKGINYSDNEECSELIECIVRYVENLMNVEELMKKEDVSEEENLFVQQILTLENVIDNIYAANTNNKRMLNILQQCVKELSGKGVDSFAIYLFLQGVLFRDKKEICQENMEKILYVMEKDAENLKDYIICHFDFLREKSTETVWAELMSKLIRDNNEAYTVVDYQEKESRIIYVQRLKYNYLSKIQEEFKENE